MAQPELCVSMPTTNPAMQVLMEFVHLVVQDKIGDYEGLWTLSAHVDDLSRANKLLFHKYLNSMRAALADKDVQLLFVMSHLTTVD